MGQGQVGGLSLVVSPGFCTAPGVVWLIGVRGRCLISTSQGHRVGAVALRDLCCPMDLDGERWAERNLLEFHRAEAGLLHLGRSKCHVLVATELSLGQQWPEGREASGILGAAGMAVPAGQGRILPLCSALEAPLELHVQLYAQLWILRTGGRTWMSWSRARRS